MKKMKKTRGIEAMKRRYGYYFTWPWLLGVVLFVLVPMITCFRFSFSKVFLTAEGLSIENVGFKYYYELFVEDPYYVDKLLGSISGIFTSLPIIVALSLILAIILNQKFRGRMLARAVFFLPVIIAGGAVMTVLSVFGMQAGLTNSGSEEAANYMQLIDFSDLLLRLELPTEISDLLSDWLNNTFNLIWSCGVQILLFVAGLQTIPEQLYEVGKVEGISAWEEFWFVTVPMLGRIILLVVFYTMVELFISDSVIVNEAIGLVDRQNYSVGSAMLWPYFFLVSIVIGLVVLLYSKLCLKKWE